MRQAAFFLLSLLGPGSAAFLGTGLSGCTRLDEGPQKPGKKQALPLAEYRDTTVLDMYEGSRRSWVLHTLHLVRWPHSDMVHAKPVRLVVFDSLEKELVRVTSDSGSVDENVNYLLASGHVHAVGKNGVDLRTDSLRWNKSANQISTEARVRVVSEEGDILTGKGFLSDANLDNWQILSEVKGVFQNLTERVEESPAAAGPGPAADSARTDSARGDTGHAAAAGAAGLPAAPENKPAAPGEDGSGAAEGPGAMP